jgi:hypothetical protein
MELSFLKSCFPILNYEFYCLKLLVKTTSVYYFFSSPDGNGILFIFPLKIKRYSVQQEIAPNYYLNKFLSNTILIASA